MAEIGQLETVEMVGQVVRSSHFADTAIESKNAAYYNFPCDQLAVMTQLRIKRLVRDFLSLYAITPDHSAE